MSEDAFGITISSSGPSRPNWTASQKKTAPTNLYPVLIQWLVDAGYPPESLRFVEQNIVLTYGDLANVGKTRGGYAMETTAFIGYHGDTLFATVRHECGEKFEYQVSLADPKGLDKMLAFINRWKKR